MSDLKPRMVIFVEGGIIQDISCDTGIEVAILDSDTEGADESEVMKIKDMDGKEEEYFKSAYPIKSYDPEPVVVEHFFSQARTIADADGQDAIEEDV